MDRRNFLKKSLLSLAVLSTWTLGSASAFASQLVQAIEGKLGYKNQSKFPSKNCLNCKSFKVVEGQEYGECVLLAMGNAMKAKAVSVNPEGYCNMWSKIS